MVLDQREYVDQIVSVFRNYDKFSSVIHENCYQWVEKFSDEEFKYNFVKLCIDQQILN